MDTQIDRPTRFLEWAHKTFGDVGLDPQERAMRFLEEAIEVAHTAGISANTMQAIVARVTARPYGNIGREIGQALCALELFAKVAGVDAESEAASEFIRVQSIPQAEWDRRHAAKVKIGIAK